MSSSIRPPICNCVIKISVSLKKKIKHNSFEDCCHHKIQLSLKIGPCSFLCSIQQQNSWYLEATFKNLILTFLISNSNFYSIHFCFCPKHCNFFIGSSAGSEVLCGWHILGIFRSSPNWTPGSPVTFCIWRASFSYFFPKCCTMNYKLVVVRIYQLLILRAFLSCYPNQTSKGVSCI